MMKTAVGRRTKNTRAFSMIEMLTVIGILAVLVSVGAVSYVSQINRAKVSSGISILQSNIQQARQNAIALRQARRVAIDAGELDDVSNYRVFPVQVWIEGKYCEELDFSDGAYCQDPSGKETNVIQLSDPETLPSGISIADIDGLPPGKDDNPSLFYIEFNSRGAVSKVYFEGQEDILSNQIAPVIHATRDGEQFTINDKTGDYQKMTQDFGNTDFDKGNEKNSFERYKVNTLEVVRLTGRTRKYDYAVLDPWPIDNPPEETE